VCGAEEVEGGHEVCGWEDLWGEGVEGEDGGVGSGLMDWGLVDGHEHEHGRLFLSATNCWFWLCGKSHLKLYTWLQ
jgi:hypothetical protein